MGLLPDKYEFEKYVYDNKKLVVIISGVAAALLLGLAVVILISKKPAPLLMYPTPYYM